MKETQQAFKVGRDPRMLPEYEALRSEINKLSHASRPEVDWALIHRLASRIFEVQGVDLQTALYFTLARSRLNGLTGFTEGCEFLANLIVTQWDAFWPPVHQERARVEMIDWFIARISDVVRQYSISHDDKRLIYRCERALQLISEKLHHSGLSRIPRIENLTHFIEGYTHLFDETEIVIVSEEKGEQKEEMQVPPMVFFKSDLESQSEPAPLPQGSILIGREKGQMKPTVLKIEPRRKQKPAWFWFACGLLACALPVAAFWGWQQMEQEKSRAVARLQQPVDVPPKAPGYEDIRQVRIALGERSLQEMEGELVTRYQAQLERIGQASPLYWLQYGDELRGTLQTLYPDSMAVKAMEREWQERLAQYRGSERQPDYQRARSGVDGLLAQLHELERQRKTVTISYLKGELFEVQKSLMSGVPLSQRLSVLERRKAASEPVNAAELKGLEDELRALEVRLYQLQQRRGDS
ncbi:VasL domain-containing protein [Aeromonas simiae]|uniref:VasL domain-containing protein n=1 Tax=Aeromonas simiae TaxID=218936 RepID=UPI0005A88A55|nr:VasL domain-containing protein [Aeromonas simiae]